MASRTLNLSSADPSFSIRKFTAASRNGQSLTARHSRPSAILTRASGVQRPSFSIGAQQSYGVICAVCDSQNVSRSVGLAFINVPIAEAVITDVSDTQFYPKTIHKMQMMEASRILVPARPPAPHTDLDLRSYVDQELPGVPVIHVPKTDWSQVDGMKCIQDVAFKTDLPSIEFALKDSAYAVSAFSAAMKYIQEEFGFNFGRNSVRIKYQPPADVMMISLPTIRSLELLQNAQATHSKDCLFGLLNKTKTPMGSRLLRSNILQPSTQVSILTPRFDAIEELLENDAMLDAIREALDMLKSLGDVEQLLTKLIIVPKDGSVYESEQAINNLLKLKSFLGIVPELFRALSTAATDLLTGIHDKCRPEPADDVLTIFDDTMDHRAKFVTKPLELRNQRVHTIKHEISANLDIQRKLYEDFNKTVHDYVNNLEEDVGAKIALKYTNSRQFYLRVKASDFGSHGLPSVFVNRTRSKDHVECQTLKLVEYNEQINRAVNNAICESDEVVRGLLADIQPHIFVLFKYCDSIALVDMLASFATLAKMYNYTRPEIQENVFSLIEARHPILDVRGVGQCIPNDYFVTEESRFQIITGQNMSGKSTYIRAIAMIYVMAQAGSFVPADSARMPMRHSLFARVSTDDALEANLSTFSVEMREMGFILRNVNSQSLVIVDELGRATSTRDGLAIATAMSEALLQSGSTVYFATHFAELARGLGTRIGVINRHLKSETHAASSGSENLPTMKMLYRVADGPETEEGYGINLARAIGFPPSILARAELFAAELRSKQSANQTNKHELAEARRRKLVSGLVRQLRLAEQSQASDEELWQYFREIRDEFWSKMLQSSEGNEGDEGDEERVAPCSSDDMGKEVEEEYFADEDLVDCLDMEEGDREF